MKLTIFTFLATVIFSLNLTAQDKIYVHTATADNISGNTSQIDHPDLNGNPDARLVLVHRSEGPYNNHVTGVYYDGSYWRVFNEDLAPMVVGSKYNIYLSDPANYIIHTATSENTDIFLTALDPPIGQLHYIFATNYWEGVYNNFKYSTRYISGVRYLYHADFLVDIPFGAKFMVLTTGDSSSSTVYTHVTDASNVEGYLTYLDHPALNGNPDAAFIFQHYYGMGSGTENDINKVLSTWYESYEGKWTIYTEDDSPMPSGLVFDIRIAEVEVLAIDDLTLAENLKVYPNPAEDIVNISSSLMPIQAVEIYDITGKLLQSYEQDGNDITLDVSALPSGLYMTKIKTDEGWFSQKLIKK